MKMKRILAMALAVIMCCGLVSCKKEKLPTAEELLTNEKLTASESVDADIKLDFEATLSLAELMGEGNDGTMDIGLGVDANLLYDGEASHLTGTVGVQMLGMEYGEEVETYSLTTLDGTQKTYTKNPDSGEWTYSTGGTEKNGDMHEVFSLDPAIFTNLQLAPVEKDDTVYTVTGQVKLSDVMDKASVDTEDMMGLDSIPEDMAVDMTLVYDRETQNPKRMSMVLTPDSGATNEMNITTFSLEIIINSIGDVEVEIPSDVIANAVDEGSFDASAWGDSEDFPDSTDGTGDMGFGDASSAPDGGASSSGGASSELGAENWELLPK